MKKPDDRFNVAVERFGDVVVFCSTTDRTPPARANWEHIPNSSVLLVGNVKDALIGLINELGNEGMNEKINGGIHPATMRKIRTHLGIAHSPGRGGYRGEKHHGQ